MSSFSIIIIIVIIIIKVIIYSLAKMTDSQDGGTVI